LGIGFAASGGGSRPVVEVALEAGRRDHQQRTRRRAAQVATTSSSTISPYPASHRRSYAAKAAGRDRVIVGAREAAGDHGASPASRR
jgi:hypothetical protein